MDSNNATEVQIFTQNLYDWSLRYLNDIRNLEKEQVETLRKQSTKENKSSMWDLLQSVIVIICVLVFVAPFIVALTVKTTLAGETFIDALARRSFKISKEQKKSEKLILKLLPPVVANRLIQQKVFYRDGLTFRSFYKQ